MASSRQSYGKRRTAGFCRKCCWTDWEYRSIYGPHLHYQLDKGKKNLDPVDYHGTFRRRLSDTSMGGFLSEVSPFMQYLDGEGAMAELKRLFDDLPSLERFSFLLHRELHRPIRQQHRLL